MNRSNRGPKVIPVRRLDAKADNSGAHFSIRRIEDLTLGKALVHDLHRHDFYFILAVIKGRGVHEIDFVPYPVHDHSIFILRPGQVHRLELSADSTGFLLAFDLANYSPAKNISEHRWKKASGKNHCSLEKERFLKLHSLLSNIAAEMETKQEGYWEAIKSYLNLFFVEYIRQSKNPDSIAKSDSKYTQERFEDFLDLLERNITTVKSVAKYAELLRVTSYQLNAITKASVGKTVSQLINEQIILEAKRNLLATPNQIKEVADQLGYEDVSYFIRFFKKHVGLSPDAFRKKRG